MESGNRFRRASKVEAAPTSLFSDPATDGNPVNSRWLSRRNFIHAVDVILICTTHIGARETRKQPKAEL